MANKKPYRHLKVLLAKAEFSEQAYRDFLAEGANVNAFDVSEEHEFEGVLFVKNTADKRPGWAQLTDSLVGQTINQITNRSSSAVLLISADGRILAFPFGYGRFLLNTAYFVQDFGLKTALNTLDHESLRGVDLHTLEDQPIQKKSQAARGSEASVFGIDVSRDVLRAVTGAPRNGVDYINVSGGDAIYAFGLNMLVSDIPSTAHDILGYYDLELYKDSFGWVDNIRKIKDKDTIKHLDDSLLHAIKNKNRNLMISIPEIIQWDDVLGFSFTRTKNDMSPVIDADAYLDNIDHRTITIASVKRDRIYSFDIYENESSQSVYSCLYLEIESQDTKNVIFGGNWYEIDKSFMLGVESVLDLIDVTDIDFPGVRTWKEGDKRRIEKEGDYNTRVAGSLHYYLLDKRLVKCSKTTTPIELCDLLTEHKQLIHVKHRKGGSAGLSHLFAQGAVAAQVMLGDRAFRKEARKIIRRVDRDAGALIPIDGLQSSDYEIVYLILGDEAASVKENLPFFSKVNLVRTYEELSQRGFSVRIGGAPKVEYAAV